ncbi:hypothetical protein DNH61_11235 [Paenibacillus sambharensis]|uniref:YqhG family protein n=1 Tax=Paenibacillus sambharensis TaxID=1803190 RepID=A0A2W1LNE8_9BACL|nr:YqhG family protein [Paenibacillus sambharensis]PZD95994.1 hypothetical protein DNH61_11235 [Paenibacillus sambharensis]
MNNRQIHKFVERYLEATGCGVLEKSPSHFKVKLSPAADRELTGRPYYWSFVDRTGAEPETMSFLFVTNRDKYDAAEAKAAENERAAADAPPGVEAALGRSFGHIHGSLNAVRMPREDLYFGSRRLDQLFQAVRSGGKFVCLFQEPETRKPDPLESVPYTPWLGVNIKVGFECDRKREELHSFGISLATGVCVEQFYDRLLKLKMTPRLPPNIHIARSSMTVTKAAGMIEQQLERKLKSYDYSWAEAAAARLDDELERINLYYEPLIAGAEDEEQHAAIAAQYANRQDEIRWQLSPRVTASAINCGIFHLSGID